MRTAIDTNVLSAIWDEEPLAAALTDLLVGARRAGSLTICGAVFAEALAYPRADEEFVRAFLSDTGITVDVELDEAVWAETGRRYGRYADRRRRSSNQEAKRMLADFLIGSHALLRADQLMTRDQSRYVRDFPELRLI